MRKCEKCGAELPEGAAFCGVCGTPVAGETKIICPYCQQEVDGGQLFCPQCGHRIAKPQEPEPKPEPAPTPRPQPRPEPRPEPKPDPRSEAAALVKINKTFRDNLFFSAGLCLVLMLVNSMIVPIFRSYFYFMEMLPIYFCFGMVSYLISVFFIFRYRKMASSALQRTDSSMRNQEQEQAKKMLNAGYIAVLILMIIGLLIFAIDF